MDRLSVGSLSPCGVLADNCFCYQTLFPKWASDVYLGPTQLRARWSISSRPLRKQIISFQ